MTEDSLIDWMALSFVPGLGCKGIQGLMAHFTTATALFAAGEKTRLEKGVRLRREAAAALANPDPLRQQAFSELRRLQSGGAEAICLEDEAYPVSLAQIADPPPVLYIQGCRDLLNSPCVAIVGSRSATGYGRKVSFSLARDLAVAGVTVVSGLALGIDGEAHGGALSVQGRTVGVLGCGLDVVYPQQNSRFYEQIRRDGLLVSEYPLGTRPDSFRFPARNRIIAGMSSGVVVVEAARKSGSLITAEMAMDEGRDVYAVPGQVDSFKSNGTHWLLQQGAKLVQSAEDILVELRDCPLEAGEKPLAPVSGVLADLDPDAMALLAAIEVYPCSRNELLVSSGLGPARGAELLLLLELEGLVELLPGDEIRRLEWGGSAGDQAVGG